uniref:HAT C-terminal dimerisation domain-containing protein n=1 Tax=Ditylenchus dipsaci TaxID=166011 RepID=A0A915DQ50_9BILA
MPNGHNPPIDFFTIFQQQANTLFAKSFNNALKPASNNHNNNLSSNRSTPSRLSSSTPIQQATTSPAPPVIPGALAVAASPAAQLFPEDDWSWHRNPQASIRSGGTNKQTPVWKYFVYNKTENLSRCIVGSCTYMLKGPHTSTLACHLKKHTAEYAEFQKLKSEYSRERNVGGGNQGQGNGTPSSNANNNKNSSSGSSSASSCASSSSVGGGGGQVLQQPGLLHPHLFNTSTPLHSRGGCNMTRNGGMLSPNSTSSSPFDTMSLNGIFGMANLPPLNSAMNTSMGYYANTSAVTTPVSTIPKKPAQNGKSNNSVSDIANLLSARAVAAAAAAAAELKQQSCSPQSAEDDFSGQSPNSRLPQAATTCTPKSSTSNVFHSALNLAGSSGNTSNNSRKNVSSCSVNQTSRSSLSSSPATTSISSVSQHSAAASATQIVKKKHQQEDRQHQLQINLAMCMATSKLPSGLLHNPFFKDLLECTHPGFVLPTGVRQIEELINAQYSYAVEAVKKQISSASKISLLIDVIRLAPSANLVIKDEQIESKSCRICVSAAFFSALSQSIEVVLLGIDDVDCSIEGPNLAAMVLSTTEKLMDEYNFTKSSVSRILVQPYPSDKQILELNDPQLSDNQLVLLNNKVSQTFSAVFDKDHLVQNVRKSFYTMILAFLASSTAALELNILTGQTLDLRIIQPFEALASTLIAVKDSFLMVCRKHVDSSLILNQEEWSVLSEIAQLSSLFQNYMSSTLLNGSLLTLDQVVPSLKQIENSLEQDFSSLDDLPSKLWEDLSERCAPILDPDHQNFDGIFLQATMLNPHLAARFLDESQTNYARQAVQQVLAEKLQLKCPKASDVRKSSVESCSSMSACEVKSDIIDYSQEEQLTMNMMAVNMVQTYFQDVVSISAGMRSSAVNHFDALKFWQLNRVKCPELSELAVELLSIPSAQVSLGRADNGRASKEGCDWRKEIMQSLEAGDQECSLVQRDAFLAFNQKFVIPDAVV